MCWQTASNVYNDDTQITHALDRLNCKSLVNVINLESNELNNWCVSNGLTINRLPSQLYLCCRGAPF